MSSSYHPHNHHSAVELRISSFGSSLKVVIYPPFYPALSVSNVPSLPVVADGLSLPVSKVESAVCQRSWLACAWELQMLGVGRVLMERMVWLCGWKEFVITFIMWGGFVCSSVTEVVE